jgi:hypothetical protein
MKSERLTPEQHNPRPARPIPRIILPLQRCWLLIRLTLPRFRPVTNGEAPSGLPEMNREHLANGGLLNDLLSNGIITQAEYDALSEAI